MVKYKKYLKEKVLMEIFKKETLREGSVVIQGIDFSDVSEVTNLIENMMYLAITNKKFKTPEDAECATKSISGIVNRLKVVRDALKCEDTVSCRALLMSKVSNEELLQSYDILGECKLNGCCDYIESKEKLEDLKNCEDDKPYIFMQIPRRANVFSESLSAVVKPCMVSKCGDLKGDEKKLYKIYLEFVEILRYILNSDNWKTDECNQFESFLIDRKVHKGDVLIGDYLISAIVSKLHKDYEDGSYARYIIM